jgi:uncharacterized protein YhbP (UPF0306 family)
MIDQASIPDSRQNITAVKDELQTYCATTYATIDVNQMRIIESSKEFLAHLNAQNFSQINSINTYDF